MQAQTRCIGVVVLLALVVAGCGRRDAAAVKLGSEAMEKGDFDLAISQFTEAIRLDPKNAEMYYLRGVAYKRKGKFDKAVTDFTEAIRLNPTFYEAYCHRGSVHAYFNDPNEAIADYTAAIRVRPTSSDAYCLRGEAYAHKGEYDKAIADCNEAVRLNPTSSQPYCSRGEVYGYKREYDKAIADCNEAIRLDPRSHRAYYYRGEAYGHKAELDMAIGKSDKADAELHKAIGDSKEAVRLNPAYQRLRHAEQPEFIRNYSFPREYLQGELRRIAKQHEPKLGPGTTPAQVREREKLNQELQQVNEELKSRIAAIFDPVTAELVKLKEASSDRKADQRYRRAVDAATTDAAKCREIAEFGVPHVRDGHVTTLLFTVPAMEDWKKGMTSYGVLYDPQRDYWPNKTLETKDAVPNDLRQINGGDWQGAFEDSSGQFFVPGLRWLQENAASQH
jgi:tetratricopeptide (TPR) repeat protein